MKRLLRTEKVFLAVLFIGLFALAARNLSDPDLWWHLKTGQFIVEHNSVPHSDPFSYTRAGQPWVAHEWLSDALLYEVQRIAGFGGLIVAFAGVLCATFLLLYLRCGLHPYVAGVGTLFAAWATMPVWGVRPQVLSLLLTSLWLFILERSERTPKLLWWTLPLTLLWVNLHAGFAVGIALSGMFLAGDWTELRLGQSKHNASHLRMAALILLLDLLFVPLNPNGWRMFSYPFQTLRSAAMQNYIAEWASPNFHHAEYWPFLLLVLGTFAALWSRELRPRDIFLLLVGLYAGLRSVRMMPLFILISVPVVCRQLGTWFNRPQRSRVPPAPVMLLNAVMVLAMAVFACAHVVRVVQHEPEAKREQFPVRALAFLQSHPATGPLFNHYDWGGYLIWKMYPTTKVFIDGRADLYGDQFLDRFAHTYQFTDDWQQALRRWKVETVLIPADSALATGLRNSPGWWSVSYEDAQSVLLTSLPGASDGTADRDTAAVANQGR